MGNILPWFQEPVSRSSHKSFFYLWCYFFLPLSNRFIVSVQRRTLWAQIGEDYPIKKPNAIALVRLYCEIFNR
jgi:hypothetical protein